MTCASCGSPAVSLEDSEGGTTEGRFVERYECADCGATGRITGEASAPAQEWRRTGGVFRGECL
jgi:hypothetical protein